MHIVIGGASGFLGAPLVSLLRESGHEVTQLVRADPRGDHESLWSPSAGRVDQVLIDRADAIVNLSGAAVAHWPWSASYRRKLLASRVDCTATLARAIAVSPKPPTLISASGMSYYGSTRGEEELTEDSSPGEGFLPDVVHAWEAAAQPARDAGARVCHIRTTLVLDKHGGTLKTLLPIFRLGLGGKLASGDQYFSVISKRDWLHGVLFLLENDSLSGPFNFGNPNPTTNTEFTRRLGDALHRPTIVPAPGFAIKAVLGGRLSSELLGSLRVIPARLEAEGFTFEDPDLGSTIATALR